MVEPFTSRTLAVASLKVALALLFVPNAVRAQDSWQPWQPVAFESLPETKQLPLLKFFDGREVNTLEDWERRREEMKAIVLYYQYGRMPPRPDLVTAEVESRGQHQSGKGTEERLTLVIDSKHQLRMRIALYRPDGDGPFPVVIREEGTLGGTQSVPMFLEKGYMFIEYARHDLDPDKNDVVGPAQTAYPDYDWATLAVWAWGGMRVVDWLETRADVDLKHIAITGHSRGGKMALLAGALDQRFALVVPNGSGAGGAGSYRVLGPGAESAGMNDKPHWYHERMQMFSEKEQKLPFDQHFLKALVAPRALLCTESTDDLFANPYGTQVSTHAAMEAYDFLKADRARNALHYRRGEHASSSDDWRVLLDYAEWQFFGREPAKKENFAMSLVTYFATIVSPEEGTPDDALANIQWVRIEAPGNEPDVNHFGAGSFGRVDRVFEISRHPITNRQLAPFSMDESKRGQSAMGETATGVQWRDAIDFCNWLNRDATGVDAYPIGKDGTVGPRDPSARYFLPSEDEWYKAAYYDPKSGRYRFFAKGGGIPLAVGAGSPDGISPFGVEGMGGRIWEWTETPVGGRFRAIRSGSWFQGNNRQAAGRFYSNPDLGLPNVGFRIARTVERK